MKWATTLASMNASSPREGSSNKRLTAFGSTSSPPSSAFSVLAPPGKRTRVLFLIGEQLGPSISRRARDVMGGGALQCVVHVQKLGCHLVCVHHRGLVYGRIKPSPVWRRLVVFRLAGRFRALKSRVEEALKDNALRVILIASDDTPQFSRYRRTSKMAHNGCQAHGAA